MLRKKRIDLEKLATLKAEILSLKEEFKTELKPLISDIINTRDRVWTEVDFRFPHLELFPLTIKVNTVHQFNFSQILLVSEVIKQHGLHIDELETDIKFSDHKTNYFLHFECSKKKIKEYTDEEEELRQR